MATFRINDMTCGHCAGAIARAVADVDKAARIEVDVRGKLVTVTSTAADSELMEAIQEAGYTPEQVASVPASSPPAAGCGCGPAA